jgi:lycopene beta-cyclase
VFGRFTYLTLELMWAVPILVIQWSLGWPTLKLRFRLLALAVVLCSAYLTLADAFAIGNGIWLIHSNRILGIRVIGVPIEEAVFFLVTNAMVVQSVLLVDGVRRGRKLMLSRR